MLGIIKRESRAVLTALFVVFFVTLILLSSFRNEGDGADYMAMALQMANGSSPSFTPEEIEGVQKEMNDIGHGFQGISLAVDRLRNEDGEFDLTHFWFYSLLAVPGIWLAKLFDVDPQWAFVLVNVVLLTSATWLLLGYLRLSFVILLVVGPVIWWLDKAHTEIFTFALLAGAFVLFEKRPGPALLMVAAAATQNLPITLAVPLLGAAAFLKLRKFDRGLALWCTAAFALSVLHPLYYGLRLGVPTPTILLESTGLRVPTFAEFSAVAIDPNIGFLGNFPALLLVGVLGLWGMISRSRQKLKDPLLVAAAILAVFFLFSFSQTTNFNHGATQGISRYSMWLIPLSIPVLRYGFSGPKLRLVVLPVILASSSFFVFRYNPGEGGGFLSPTWFGAKLLTNAPRAYNPVPEIFFERVSHTERPPVPLAVEGCTKVLLVDSEWPEGCEPEGEVPSFCDGPLALCYANRRGGGYEFVRGPSSCGLCGWASWPSTEGTRLGSSG